MNLRLPGVRGGHVDEFLDVGEVQPRRMLIEHDDGAVAYECASGTVVQIFLSYSSKDLAAAERIDAALVGAGHEVFFDRNSLPPGDTFDLRILGAIEDCDGLVFLVSPDAVAPGSYALTELGFAERRWKNPARRVLPVMVRPTDIGAVPTYLRGISILRPRGDVGAEVLAALTPRWPIRPLLRWALPVLLLAVVAGLARFVIGTQGSSRQEAICGSLQSEARAVADRIEDFARAAKPEEQEAYDRGTDLAVDGNTRNAAWFRFNTLYDRNNQRMNDMARAAQDIRNQLSRQCFRPGGADGEQWAESFGSSDRRRFATFVAMAEALRAFAAAPTGRTAQPPSIQPAGSIR